VPPAELQGLVVRDLAVAGQLAADPRVDLFSFIGAARVGWTLRARLAPGTRCLLEHGGAAPVVVLPDADHEAALPALLRGAFYHAGQVCVSVQRIYVVGPRARELAERLAESAAQLRVGDPAHPETEVGPLIRPSEVTRVTGLVAEARALGSEVLCGGQPLSETAYAPTVLWNPPDAARIVREEAFGPVVSVIPVADEEAALARANATPYIFQAAVYTRDLAAALRVTERLRATTVLVNDVSTFRVDWMPFGGRGLSGLGLGGIPDTFRACRPEKLVVLRS
jgi:acyl-CoA reductase-like NAD-dependent aldehyde dehydrogenase